MNRCMYCEHYDDCEYAEIINFCEDCKHYPECYNCTVYCEAGLQIECNNDFELKSDLED